MPVPPDQFIKSCLPPVVDAKTRLLVLGSLPGDRSLAASRYYAHPRNQFWQLIGAATGRDLAALDYPDRLVALLDRGVGLWDVIASAERAGSADAAIRDAHVNDLPALARSLPLLAAIAFNGGTAARTGERAMAGVLPAVERVALPSSSPLHAIGLDRKLPAWRTLDRFLV
ncbi:DNA-deoxyinosine glycosylase [Sphingomonas aerophila]|uniref:Hypoxanthine-DNA glycosylase n=1 Tax=Sphingomonas aerophila TaxID=1344948 RepID=A0A7W9BEH6_9SPHN|nr:DNA-deoxyinosine glycosylase [Sphingomonas aerophila]MBB5715764.1 hypoxanthine-DNA glycosylase [Sphingomonas aerophila]